MGLAPSRVCENTAKNVVSRCLSQFFNTLLGAGKIWDKHYLTNGPLLVYNSSHSHAPRLRFTVICAGLPRPHRVVRVSPDLAPTATAGLARKIAKISTRPGNLFGATPFATMKYQRSKPSLTRSSVTQPLFLCQISHCKSAPETAPVPRAGHRI